jgi:hypothetical protein
VRVHSHVGSAISHARPSVRQSSSTRPFTPSIMVCITRCDNPSFKMPLHRVAHKSAATAATQWACTILPRLPWLAASRD